MEIIIKDLSQECVKCPRCRDRHYCKDNYSFLCDRCCSVLLGLDDDFELPLLDGSGTIKMKEIKDGIRKSYEEQKKIYLKEEK